MVWYRLLWFEISDLKPVSNADAGTFLRSRQFDLSPKKLHQRPFSWSNMSHLGMIRISFDQARAIAIQSAILYHTRTAKQILVKGTLEGINEAKCTQLLRMSLYRSCIHRENVFHCNWKKQYFKLKKLIHVLLTTCRLRILFLLCATHLYQSKAKHRSFNVLLLILMIH